MSKKEFPRRGDVFLVSLDPTIGTEIQKTRPAVIVSNDASNEMSTRIIVAPITSSATHLYPFEASITVAGKKGKVLLDQIRSLDKQRLSTKITSVDDRTQEEIDTALKIALALR